jgi:hypothetical protein
MKLVGYLRDVEEKSLFDLFSHCIALLDDETAHSLIHLIRNDLRVGDINEVLTARNSPEGRSGLNAFLAALAGQCGVVNFNDEEFDLACASIAAMLKAGLPDDAEWIAKVARMTDLALLNSSRSLQPIEEYAARVPVTKDGNVDFDTLRSVVGSTGETVSTITAVAGVAQFAKGMGPVKAAIAGGKTLIQSSIAAGGTTGKLLSAVSVQGGRVVASSTARTVLNVAKRLKLGNPWVMAGITIAGEAAAYFAKDEE